MVSIVSTQILHVVGRCGRNKLYFLGQYLGYYKKVDLDATLLSIGRVYEIYGWDLSA
jgi:hypothetical protein